MPEKKYIVRLTQSERDTLHQIVKTLSGSSQKVRRAQILLQADVDGPGWTDKQIAQAYGCRSRTVENARRTLVEQGFELALSGRKRECPPRAALLDGEQEAKIIATRLGSPPAGFANWSLRLLTDTVVELGIVDSVSRETVRRTLKKTT